MGKKFVLTLAFVSLIQVIASTDIICYHGTWSHYRTGNGQFSVSATPANLCTHYIYTFVGLDSSTNKVQLLDSWLDVDLNGFGDAVALKNTNPNLKVLLAVGGWNEGSAKYSVMAATQAGRAAFIESALALVLQYGFDGFDLDWEYPARRDSTNTADKENFSLLIQEFYEAFNPLGLIVTAAVSATPASVDISYDIPVLSKYLDKINVMTYDFHGAWDTVAYHNSPLYSRSELVGTDYEDYSVNASIQGWISRGASPAKLAMGMPFYGRTFTLSSSSSVSPGCSTTGAGGAAGPYTQTSGFLGYNEIIEKFNAGGWTQVWDEEQQVPYAYSGTTWLSYDNEKSLALKVEYAKSLGLGAVMIWSVETEDFLGLSGSKYPLLNAINENLGSTTAATSSSVATTQSATTSTTAQATTSSTSSSATTTQAATTTTSSSAASTSAPSDSSSIADANSCTAEGYFRSSSDCSVYYYCQSFNGGFIGYTMQCTATLYYDITTGNCNYADLVSC